MSNEFDEARSPRARRDDLLTERVGQEYVVYDPDRSEAHRLSPTAVLVWDHCDGDRGPTELARIVSEHTEAGAEESEALVDLALEQLAGADLLQGDVPMDGADDHLNRRTALRRIGQVGAAVALLPLVTTVAAPTPAMARSGSASSRTGSPQGTNTNEGTAPQVDDSEPSIPRRRTQPWWCRDETLAPAWAASLFRGMFGC